MKHKVKLIGVKGDVITLEIDGVRGRYQHTHPSVIADAVLLHNIMDEEFLKSMAQAACLAMPKYGLLPRLGKLFSQVWESRSFGLWDSRNKPTLIGTIADYIEKVGVEVNIDKKTKGLVILKADVDKIRKGKI